MKVFIPEENQNPLLHYNLYHDLPFHLEKDKFIIVNSVEDADIIPSIMPQNDTLGFRLEDKINYIGPNLKNKWIVMMMHTHASETTVEWYNQHVINPWLPYTDRVLVVDLNQCNTSQIPYNFCWNRQKAYFIDHDKYDLQKRLWSGDATKKMYSLTPIPDHSKSNVNELKKFLLSARTHEYRLDHVRNQYRCALINATTNINDMYWSNWNPDNLNLLWPEEMLFDNMEELYKSFGGWWPVANHYFNTSFISVFVETLITTNNKLCSVLSEKTFDPLIKGHFILPFGYQGLVEDIRAQGFKLPNWIDYTYDNVEDPEERFQMFLSSFYKIRSLSISTLVDLHIRDRTDILEYNRNLFFTKPYDSLYTKLKNKLQFTSFYL